MNRHQEERMLAVLRDVAGERRRQHARFGEQNLGRRMLHPPALQLLWEESQRQQREGLHTWDNVLVEELIEAVDEPDPARLRAELVQVAAVAVQWIEALDRVAVPPAPRPEGLVDELAQPQPPPKAGDGPLVIDEVVRFIERTRRHDNQALTRDLVAFLRTRHEGGVAKYGTPLRPHNGRDAVVDAAQESGDGLQYAIQRLLEVGEGEPFKAYLVEKLAKLQLQALETALVLHDWECR